MAMDLRYYNEETGQWEVMFANATDLSSLANTVSTINNRTSNIDNTSDINKPVSTAQKNAIDESVVDIYKRYGKKAFYVADWNEIVDSGIYSASNLALNRPFDAWLICEYIAHDERYGELRGRMIQAPYREVRRQKVERVWQPWIIVDDAESVKAHQFSLAVGSEGLYKINLPSINTERPRLITITAWVNQQKPWSIVHRTVRNTWPTSTGLYHNGKIVSDAVGYDVVYELISDDGTLLYGYSGKITEVKNDSLTFDFAMIHGTVTNPPPPLTVNLILTY